MPEIVVPVPVEGGDFVMVNRKDFERLDLKYRVFAKDERGDLFEVVNDAVVYLVNRLMGRGRFEQISNDPSDYRSENFVPVERDDE